MENNGWHVVFGASGGLGNAVARELAAQGKRVRAVNRGGDADVPGGVEKRKGDALQLESVRACCKGATVVYHCVNPPYTEWPRLFPPMMSNLIEAASEIEARLIFADNLYMYGPVSGALTENLRYAATGHKGRTRARVADQLMEAHHSGKIKAAIGRASDFYGPRVTNAMMAERVFEPALTGGTAMIIGDPDQLHTYSYIEDVARGLIALGEREQALGEIWHVPNAETVTTRQFLAMVYEEAGQRLKFRTARRWLITLLGLFSPLMRELKETLYQFEQPFVVDHSKYERAFGAEVTPLRTGIRKTLDWFRGRLEQ